MSSLTDYLHDLVRRTMPIRCIKLPELAFYTTPKIVKYLEGELEKNGINESLWLELKADANKANGPGLEKRIDDIFQATCKYSIFSHTWLRLDQDGEIDYSNAGCCAGSLEDSLKKSSEIKPLSYSKLRGFFKFSIAAGVSFAWADTVCINKDPAVTPSELSICIPNMFGWYSRSAICIVYLAESNTIEHHEKDF